MTGGGEGVPTRGNPARAFRLEDKLWEAFKVAAESRGWDRGSLLGDFVNWYTNELDKPTYRRVEAPFHARRRRTPDQD